MPSPSTAVTDALARARAAGRRAVLVTVVHAAPGLPTHVGDAVVLDADGAPLAGSLHDAELEAAARSLAREAVVHGAARRVVELTAGAHAAVELSAEVHEPEPAVVVLGATTAGRAAVRLARAAERRAVLAAPAGAVDVPAGVDVRADEPARVLLAAPPGADDVVLAADTDAPWLEEALRVALASDAGAVALLGSGALQVSVRRRLQDAGVPPDHLSRLLPPPVAVEGADAAVQALLVLADAMARTLSPAAGGGHPRGAVG